MKIKKTTLTQIELSKSDVEKIIKDYFAEKGYVIETYTPLIAVVYDGCLGDSGTDEFTGITMSANKIVEKIDLK
jgi:hypothetical protein